MTLTLRPGSVSPSALRQALVAGAMAAAPALLGCRLVHRSVAGVITARIVETEAYTHDDPASHSFNGQTPRNAPMFGRAGTAYVYISYGMHRCMNVVTGCMGTGEAVLIRAVEPIEGKALMIAARGWAGKPLRQLCNGPGKVCQAMGITLEFNGADLLGNGNLHIEPGKLLDGETMKITPRIGISKATDWPRRFMLVARK